MRRLVSFALFLTAGSAAAQTISGPAPTGAPTAYSLERGTELATEIDSRIDFFPSVAPEPEILSAFQNLTAEAEAAPAGPRREALLDLARTLAGSDAAAGRLIHSRHRTLLAEIQLSEHRARLNRVVDPALKALLSRAAENEPPAAEASAPKAEPVPLSPRTMTEAAKLANATGELIIDLDFHFLPDYEGHSPEEFPRLRERHGDVGVRPRMALWSAPTEADAATARHWVSLAARRSLLGIDEDDWRWLSAREGRERRFGDSLSALFHIAYGVQESPRSFDGSEVVDYLVSSSKSIAESIRAYRKAGFHEDLNPDSRMASIFNEMKQSQYRIGDAVKALVAAKSPLLTPEAVRQLKWVAADTKAWKALYEAFPEPAKVSIAVPVSRESRLARFDRWATAASKAAVWLSWLIGIFVPGGLAASGVDAHTLSPWYMLPALAFAVLGGTLVAKAPFVRSYGWKAAASIFACLTWALAGRIAYHEGNHWLFGAFTVLMALGGWYSSATYMAMVEREWRSAKKQREAAAAAEARKEWHEGIDPEIVAEVEEAAHLEVAIQRLRIADDSDDLADEFEPGGETLRRERR